MTGESFARAGTLEMYRSLRSEERLAWQAGAMPIVTALLVGVQVRIWWFGGGCGALTGFPSVEAWFLQNWLRETAAIFEDGESWRMLTMGFLHTSPFHIAGNTLFLAFSSYNLERTIGWRNLVVLYVASVIGGSVLSSFFGPETPSLGASGGVYGLIAAMVTVAFARPGLLGPRTRFFFLVTSLPYMILMFLTGLASEMVDNSAHFGGLLTGLALGVVLAPEVAERRPGDAARTRATIVELCLLALAVPMFAGPRIEPLQDAYQRRAKVAYVDSLGLRLGLWRGDEEARARTLHYRVPASWNLSFDATRSSAFTSPVGMGDVRAWRVTERQHDDLTTPAELAGDWIEDVRDDWPAATFEDPVPARLAGHEGLRVVARIGIGSDARVLEWRGVTRGTSSLQAVWQVDDSARARLAPLQRRLLRSVRWDLPESYREAERDYSAFPESRSARRAFAREQIRVGDWQEGAELLWQTVQEDPESPSAWESALQDLRPALERIDDPDRWFAAALANAPVPKVVEEVADGLDRLGRREEAIGLLEIAWRRSPGDQRIHRSRRKLGLPRETDERTGRPWEETHDPLTGVPRSPDPTIPDLTLEAARAAGARYLADREALVRQTRLRIERGDRGALAPLLYLAIGRVDLTDEDAVGTLLDELDQVSEGRELPWLPESIASAIAADPQRIEQLRAAP